MAAQMTLTPPVARKLFTLQKTTLIAMGLRKFLQRLRRQRKSTLQSRNNGVFSTLVVSRCLLTDHKTAGTAAAVTEITPLNMPPAGPSARNLATVMDETSPPAARGSMLPTELLLQILREVDPATLWKSCRSVSYKFKECTDFVIVRSSIPATFLGKVLFTNRGSDYFTMKYCMRAQPTPPSTWAIYTIQITERVHPDTAIIWTPDIDRPPPWGLVKTPSYTLPHALEIRWKLSGRAPRRTTARTKGDWDVRFRVVALNWKSLMRIYAMHARM
ncbi:hypothetical protein BDV95DRAFT_77 [Massariosphaeria phaeospora]|uniref:F-box domain-containing protein n=1 Tax=Massariosphaeria phaeospora TaxID=100035 RepID=A0A7C8MDF8_9PLEO|nr:hypothetical protein BDV95DRAFT_77 [Massariosphaeria phaeospora]